MAILPGCLLIDYDAAFGTTKPLSRCFFLAIANESERMTNATTKEMKKTQIIKREGESSLVFLRAAAFFCRLLLSAEGGRERE